MIRTGGGRIPFALFLIVGGLVGQRGADFVAYDARAAGRGGTDVAIAEDLSALLSNPAGLVNHEGPWRIDMTLRGFLIETTYEDAFNPDGAESEQFALAPYFAISWDPDPSDFGMAGDFRLSLGLQHIAGFQNELDVSTQDFGAPLTTTRRTDYLYTGVHLGAGYRLSKSLSVGATVSLTYSDIEVMEPLELSIFQIQGLSPFSTPWGPLLNSMFGIENLRFEGVFDAEPSLGVSATLGWQWRASDTLTFGMAWRSPGFQQDYEGDVEADISRIFGEPDPVTFPNGYAVNYDGAIEDFDYPQSLALGAAWLPDEDWRLSFEVRWTNWSATHDKIRLKFRNGDNPGFNEFIGSDGLAVTQNWSWRDQFAAQAGVEWQFAEQWTARIGGGVWTSPAPQSAANPNSPGWSTLMGTVGVGYRAESWSLDLAWIHIFPREVSVGTSPISSDLDDSKQGVALDSVLISFSLWF